MAKKKKIKIDKSWFNDMVLGWFDPHFNADTRMTSPEAVQDQKKQKCCIFCVFVTLFFSVSKTGNLNTWHFPEKL